MPPKDDRQGSILGQLLSRGTEGAIVQGAGIGLRALAQFLLAAWLSAEEYGIYSYVVSIVAVLAVFSQLGLHTVVLRFVAGQIAEKEWSRVRGTLNITHKLVGVSTVFLFLVGEVTIYALSERMSCELLRSLQFGLLLLPLVVFARLRQFALQGLKRVWAARFPEEVLVPVFLIAGGYLLFKAESIGALYVVGLRIIGYIAAFILGSYWLYSFLPNSVRDVSPSFNPRQILAVGLPLLFASTMHLILNRTDILMLGALRPMGDAGVYNAVLQIAKLATFGLTAVGLIASPMMAEAHAKSNHGSLQRIVTLTAYISGASSAFFVVGVFLFGDMVLSILGPEFTRGKTAMWILVGGQVVNSWMGPVGQLLTMTGNEKAFSRIVAVAAIINVVLNAGFIPLFGMEGAAAATMITTIIWNAGLGWVAWKNLGIRPATFSMS